MTSPHPVGYDGMWVEAEDDPRASDNPIGELATIREYLERGCPEEPDASARLREELAAARDRVLESARVLLEMRAVAATGAFPV